MARGRRRPRRRRPRAPGPARRRIEPAHRSPAPPRTPTAGPWAAARPTRSPRARSTTREAFKAAGRTDAPRLVALCYFALGPDGKDAARTSLGDYYAWLGDIADQIVASAVTDADTARGYRDAFAAAGGDELIFFPASADPAQVELLAEALA